MHARFFIALIGLVVFGFVLAFGQDDFPIHDPAWRQLVDPQRENTTTTTTATTTTTTTTTTTPRLAERIRQAAMAFEEVGEAFLYVLIGLTSFVATCIAIALHIRGLCMKDRHDATVPSPDLEAGQDQLSLAGRVSLTQPSELTADQVSSLPAGHTDADGETSEDVFFDAVETQ